MDEHNLLAGSRGRVAKYQMAVNGSGKFFANGHFRLMFGWWLCLMMTVRCGVDGRVSTSDLEDRAIATNTIRGANETIRCTVWHCVNINSTSI